MKTGFGVGVGVTVVSEVLVAACARLGFDLGAVRRVAVAFEDHVPGVELDFGIRVSGAVVKRLRASLGCCLSSIGLRGCKSTEGNKERGYTARA